MIMWSIIMLNISLVDFICFHGKIICGSSGWPICQSCQVLFTYHLPKVRSKPSTLFEHIARRISPVPPRKYASCMIKQAVASVISYFILLSLRSTWRKSSCGVKVRQNPIPTLQSSSLTVIYFSYFLTPPMEPSHSMVSMLLAQAEQQMEGS